MIKWLIFLMMACSLSLTASACSPDDSSKNTENTVPEPKPEPAPEPASGSGIVRLYQTLPEPVCRCRKCHRGITAQTQYRLCGSDVAPSSRSARCGGIQGYGKSRQSRKNPFGRRVELLYKGTV